MSYMSYLSLDDFEWVEDGFDVWVLVHKVYAVTIAEVRSFNGWHLKVLGDSSVLGPVLVDSLDAAKAVANIIANQHMETYSEYYFNGQSLSLRRRLKTNGPPAFRPGVFKVG